MSVSSALDTAAAVASDRGLACFSVTASADPGTLSRLVEPFAKLNLVPHRLHAATVPGADGPRLEVDLQLAGIEPDRARRFADTLRQVVTVEAVLLSFA